MNEFHHNVTKTIHHCPVKQNQTCLGSIKPTNPQCIPELDPQEQPEKNSPEFLSYGEEEIAKLHEYYSNEERRKFEGRSVLCEAMINVPLPSLHLEFSGLEDSVCQQKNALSDEFAAKETSLKAKHMVANTQKYKTRKQLKVLNEDLANATKKQENPVTIEDLLQIFA